MNLFRRVPDAAKQKEIISMNGVCHSWIAGNAIAFLPEPVGKYWAEYRELLENAANFSDIFWLGENSSPQYLEKYPDWRDYVFLPEDGEMKMGHYMLQPARTCQQLTAAAGYLISRVLSEMRSGRHERAVKFTGILSHMIGECGQAAHVADPKMLSALFQQEGQSSLFHSPMENNSLVSYPEHSYSAQCLGDDESETVWRFVQKLAVLKSHSTKTIVPIMNAILKNDFAEAAVYASRTVGECTDIMADLLYTLYALFEGKKKGPDSVSLLELEPEDYLCDGMFNFLPQRSVMPGKKWDEPIPLDAGDGARPGIALLPEMFPGHAFPRFAFVRYRIPSGVFRRFDFGCGLNRLADRNETSGIFEIRLDGKSVWQSPPLSVNSGNVYASIQPGRAEHLELYVRDSRTETATTKFFYPCFFDMTLHRSNNDLPRPKIL
ncbi:MAG: hypothetical protein BWY31_01848 [Lentisphaerae bacterium ADurb.Bin242]|nr:MAG: hypothetical protein BWY31_01848 [Lentisphaerae bacterium ADurb.Bin242]